MLLANSELRWRATDFTLHGRASSLWLSAFADGGRVWASRFDLGTALDELHAGYGGGVRMAFGPSFIVAADVGHSAESTAPVYIGLGWTF
jgi:hemolysin activation/secretion protein